MKPQDQAIIKEIREKTCHAFDSCLYETRENDLNKKIGEMLYKKGFSLAVAESCTGGLISNYVTDVSGSSSYFNGAVIAYTNEVKISLLGVHKNTIADLGAVSSETAEEMAEGVRKLLNADIGLSSTGIAGPTGAIPGKPVGTVYIGLATPLLTIAKRLFFPEQSRKKVKIFAAQCALGFLKCYLLVSDLVKKKNEKA